MATTNVDIVFGAMTFGKEGKYLDKVILLQREREWE